MLEAAGVAAVFHPEPAEMYPPGFEASVEVGGITDVLEGAARPGHFKGVTTVVAKLFNIVGARRAYFGQKDAQQVAVLRKMVRDLNFPIQLVVCPTLRGGGRPGDEQPERLSFARGTASGPGRSTGLCRRRRNSGESGRITGAVRALRAAMQNMLADDYAGKSRLRERRRPSTRCKNVTERCRPGQGVLLSLAVRFGGARLIDNMPLEGVANPQPGVPTLKYPLFG